MLRKGSVLEDRYRIEEIIGQGGSGSVYRAIQLRTGRTLAVKEIEKDTGEEAVRRSLMLLKDLKHPGLPLVLDVLETEHFLLIVMEYISGNTLQEEMEGRRRSGKRFSVEEILQLGTNLCEILLYIHTLPDPLIYRDMKPSNIILCRSGRVVLVDLGSLCLCRDTIQKRYDSVGTAGYASPEQYRREQRLAPEADLYSLGAVLHHAITGINPIRKPFSFERITKAAPELLSAKKGRDYRRLMGLELIIEKCTRFRIEDRYEYTEDLLEDLQQPEKCYLAVTGIGKLLHVLPVFLSILALGSGIVFLRSEQAMDHLKQEGKEYCLMKAQRAEGEQVDEWIRSALQFSPGDAACFSTLLDRMLVDGIFSEEEQIRVRELLNRSAEGETEDYETILRRNPEDCFRFSYQMGTACLYGAEGLPDYITAGDFFRDVLAAAENWQPEQEGAKAEKVLLLKRTEILERICSYRGQLLLRNINIQEDRLVSIRTYWEDLSCLLEEDIPAGKLLITEMGLWREVLGILNDWPAELNEAGISWEEQRKAAERISRLVTGLQGSREAEEYPIVREQLEELEKTGEAVEKKRLFLEEAENREKRRG